MGDGLLLVVAKNDRKLRIEVAKALEGAVPDLAARQIIDRQIGPAFRNNDYAGGLNAGVDALMARIQGEGLPAPAARQRQRAKACSWSSWLMFLFVGVPILGSVLTGIFGRKLGSVLTAGAAGGLGWWLTASVLLAVGASIVRCCSSACMGVGSALSRSTRAPSVAHRRLGWWLAAAVVVGAAVGAAAGAAGFPPAAAATSAAAVLQGAGDADTLRPSLNTSNPEAPLADETDSARALNEAALARLEAQVAASESRHSGEIRMCVEAGLPLSYLWRGLRAREARAVTMFGKLRVWDTEHNNGVLIYLLLAEHAIEIVADRGLTRHVPQAQWDGMVAGMRDAFRAGQFEAGLQQAIAPSTPCCCSTFRWPPARPTRTSCELRRSALT